MSSRTRQAMSSKTRQSTEDEPAPIDPKQLPSASTLRDDEFSEINWFQCNTGIVAWDDNLKEYTGCSPEDIDVCWNCSYPLTDAGYFGGLEWDRSDPKNAVLHAALERLKELHPLPKQTFGIPVCRRNTGVIETKGSVCCIGCQRRYVEDENAYNVSEVDGLTTSMGLDAGIPLSDLSITNFHRNALKCRGGIYSFQQYRDRPATHEAAVLNTDLLVRKPSVVQERVKETAKVFKSKFRGHLLGSKAAETVPAGQAVHEDMAGLTTTEVTYSTNQAELDKLKKAAEKKKEKEHEKEGEKAEGEGGEREQDAEEKQPATTKKKKKKKRKTSVSELPSDASSQSADQNAFPLLTKLYNMSNLQEPASMEEVRQALMKSKHYYKKGAEAQTEERHSQADDSPASTGTPPPPSTKTKKKKKSKPKKPKPKRRSGTLDRFFSRGKSSKEKV